MRGLPVKILTPLTVFIALGGVAFAVLGLVGLLMVETSARITQEMRDGGYPALAGVDLGTYRIVMYAVSSLFVLSGVMTIFSGIGMFFRRNWARLLWLATLILLATWLAYSYVISIINRGFSFEELGLHCLNFFIYLALFIYFSMQKIKKEFLGEIDHAS